VDLKGTCQKKNHGLEVVWISQAFATICHAEKMNFEPMGFGGHKFETKHFKSLPL
jgi:hypothetical protein